MGCCGSSEVVDARPGASDEAQELTVEDGGAKKMHLYKGGAQWTLTFYAGTPVDDLIASIHRVCGVTDSEKAWYQDSDGNNIAISSFMPSEIRIFVHSQVISAPVASLDETAGASSSSAAAIPVVSSSEKSATKSSVNVWKLTGKRSIWKWKESSRTCGSHEIKDNGLTWGQSYNHGHGSIVGDTVWDLTQETSIISWTVRFEPFFCCVRTGVADMTSYTNDRSDIVDAYPASAFMEKFSRSYGRPSGDYNISVTCVVIPQSRELWMYRDDELEALIVVRGLPDRISPVGTLKHETYLKITNFGPVKSTADTRLNFVRANPDQVFTYGVDED